MDGTITLPGFHENVQFWNFLDETIPQVWDDKNNDGQWDHAEQIEVMDSDFERTQKTLKQICNFFTKYRLLPR